MSNMAGLLKICAIFAVISVGSCQNFQTAALIDTLQNLNCSKLVTYLKQTNLDKALANVSAATIFAPDDKAFANFHVDLSAEELTEVLKGHVVLGWFNSTVSVQQKKLKSFADDKPLLITSYNFTGKPVVTANGAIVTLPDFAATNGIVHVIDKVIYPLTSGDTLSTLQKVAPVTASFLDAEPRFASIIAGGGFTLFAPSNEAWTRVPYPKVKELLSGDRALVLLLSHTVNPAPYGQEVGKSGPFFAAGLAGQPSIPSLSQSLPLVFTKDTAGNLLVNGSNVVTADIPATDGQPGNVIHVIDRVLIDQLV